MKQNKVDVTRMVVDGQHELDPRHRDVMRVDLLRIGLEIDVGQVQATPGPHRRSFTDYR